MLQSSRSTAIRRKGLIRFVAGLALFGVGAAFIMLILPGIGGTFSPRELMFFALPIAYALSGLIELITGVSFFEFAQRWDELKGWQRGVFGTAIVLIAVAVTYFSVAFFAGS